MVRPSTGDERHVFQVQVRVTSLPFQSRVCSVLCIIYNYHTVFSVIIMRPCSCFDHQEQQRYDQPHKAFTFRMHGFESQVGPVKGVFDKEMSLNKAREHTLLRSDRPAYVTILSLGKTDPVVSVRCCCGSFRLDVTGLLLLLSAGRSSPSAQRRGDQG